MVYFCSALRDAGLHLIFHPCAWPAWLIMTHFLYVSCSIYNNKNRWLFYAHLSKRTLSCVFCIILFKHDSKPTETTLWDEAPLINLQRRKSFWLIDPISLKISWKGLDDWGAVLFLWQAERPSETRALRQRFNSPFWCQFIRPRLTKKKKKQPVWTSLKHILHRTWKRGGKTKAFMATKCFYFSSAVHLE